MGWFNRKQKEIPVWVTSEKYDDLILNYVNYYFNTFKHEEVNLVSVLQLNGEQLVQMRKWCFENESYIFSLFNARESLKESHKDIIKGYYTIDRIMKDVIKVYYTTDADGIMREVENIKASDFTRLKEYYKQLLAFDNIEVWSILDELNKLDLSFEDKRKEGCLFLLHSYVFKEVKMAGEYFKYGYYEADKEMLEDLICYCEEQLNK